MRSVIRRLLLLAAMLPAPAYAESEAAGRCTVSVTPVMFGTYYPLSGADGRTTGVITYNCSASRPIAIALNRGGAPDVLDRQLKSKGSRAHYNLYLDAAGTAVWGDGTDGTQVYRDPAPPPNVNVSIPIFGRLPSGQREAVGVYDDMIMVHLTY